MLVPRRHVLIALAISGLALASTSATTAQSATIELRGKSFEPVRLVVQQGSEVRWSIVEAIRDPHNVTSGTLGKTGLGTIFRSKLIKKVGESFSYTFDEPGSYPYLCEVHATEMVGEVIVLRPGATPPTEAQDGAAADRFVVTALVFAAATVAIAHAARLARRRRTR